MNTILKRTAARSHKQKLEQLTPYEIKEQLMKFADILHGHVQYSMLQSGRGTPNWTAGAPREVFFAMGNFCALEMRLAMEDIRGITGTPNRAGIGKRFYKFLMQEKGKPGIEMLNEVYRYGLTKPGTNADDWIFEIVEGIVGNHHPTPVRMLSYCERVVRDYLIKELFGDKQIHRGKYDLFAVEGSTAGIVYIFDSLFRNNLLKKGDKIAIGAPALSSYIKIPGLDEYGLEIVYINASQKDIDKPLFQYPESELDKLADKDIKAFLVLNPGNPPRAQINKPTREYLVSLVKEKNPDLMIITDDTYAPFVNNYNSLLNELPYNTVGVYSFSPYFGANGWRIGVVVLHEDNVYDKKIKTQPTETKESMEKMYDRLSGDTGKFKFIDRMVADSRKSPFYHTAGLSTPQQIQMMFFAIFILMDKEENYKTCVQDILQRRYYLLWEGLNLPFLSNPHQGAYYCNFDIKAWATLDHGEEFFLWLDENYSPFDPIFKLAEECSVVLLNDGGFATPQWAIRICLADLADHEYKVIGRELRAILDNYYETWEAEQKGL